MDASAPPISYEQSAALTFHHTEYLLHASVRYTQPANANANAAALGPASPALATASAAAAAATSYAHAPPTPILVIEAEQRDNGNRWTGEFSAKYIEEMSLKTGNFKKFTLFLRMLSSALSQSSETVFIDLLTFHDLEALKARKQAAAAGGAGAGPHQNPHPLRQASASTTQAAVAAAQNKRYIILTYVSEFDKVHYPLPLKFESDPNPQLLKATIARLRAEVDLLKSQGLNASLGAAASQHPQGAANATTEKYKSEIYRLAEENHRLKSIMAARGGPNSGSGGVGGDGAVAGSDGTSSSPTAALSPLEIDQLHLDLRSSSAQVSRLQSENQDLHQKLSGLMQGLPLESLGLQLSLDNMSKQISNLSAELQAEQRAHLASKRKYESEMEVMLRELEGRLEAERLLRKRCREITADLETSREELRVLQMQSRRAGVAAAASGGLRSPAQRRPVSASSPSSAVRGSSMGRPLSRPNSRPGSAASSRSNSPAPSAFNRGGGMSPAGSARGRAGPAAAPGGARSRSPSPALGGSGSRFDPSAYVKHKQEQLAKQQQRISAHNRDLRASAGTHSPQAAPAPPRARSPVVRNGVARSGLSETSPRPSRSASNASLSATSPQALRHSYSQSSSSGAGARRSPAPATSASARAMPPRAPVPSSGTRSRPSSAAASRGDASPSASASAHRPRSSGGARASATTTITDSDLDESTAYEARRQGQGQGQGRGEFDEEDEDERVDDRDRRSPPPAASKKGLSASDNIEERFSALQNFLRQQKGDA